MGDMLHHYEEGGWAMHIILFWLIMGIAFAIERTRYLYRARIDRAQFVSTLEKCILSGDLSRAIKVCSASQAPLGRIVKAGLIKANRSDDEVQSAMDEEALKELPKLEQRTAFLGLFANLSMLCGLFGTAWMAGYSAAKAAVINFSRAAASEGAAANIRCNVVIPGVVATPATAGMLADDKGRANTEKLIPLRRVGEPVELANAILFLASDEASYVTGACLTVDGGRSSDLYTVLE